MQKIWMAMLATALVGCTTVQEEEPLAPEPIIEGAEPVAASEDPSAEPYDPSKDLTLITCGAHETLDLIDTPVADALLRLPENRRIIRPGDVVTQDYDTSRMNVFVDEAGTITKIECG